MNWNTAGLDTVEQLALPMRSPIPETVWDALAFGKFPRERVANNFGGCSQCWIYGDCSQKLYSAGGLGVYIV